jgi:hypothetical protein
VGRRSRGELRYTWESNSVANWQNDLLAPFTAAINTCELYMSYNNPNYNVQISRARSHCLAPTDIAGLQRIARP